MTHRDEFGFEVPEAVAEYVRQPHVSGQARAAALAPYVPPPAEQDAALESCRCAKGARCGPCMSRSGDAARVPSVAGPLLASETARFTINEIAHKLRHGAGSEFSVMVKPRECAALLAALGLDTTGKVV